MTLSSLKILKSFLNSKNEEEIVNAVDETISKMLECSDNCLNLNEKNWKFALDPVEYYNLRKYGDDVDDIDFYLNSRTFLYLISKMITFKLGQVPNVYFPINMEDVITNFYRISYYYNKPRKMTKNEKIYYYIITHSKYKDYFMKDEKFLKAVKDKKTFYKRRIKCLLSLNKTLCKFLNFKFF